MRGKTLPQFSVPPPLDRRRPGTTRVGREALVVEAARALVAAARRESAILPRSVAESLEALTDALRALPEGRPSEPPLAPPHVREPSSPTVVMPAAVEAWWQIEATRRQGETRYVARWFESIGPEGAVIEERDLPGLSESLQAVLGRRG